MQGFHVSYPAHACDRPQTKMEKDIASADKTAKIEQKALAKTAAANKAEDIAGLENVSEHGSAGSHKGDEGKGGQEGGDEGSEVKNITAELANRTPEEVFKQFDTDGSGLIDFDEFRAMLPQLGINISMPKVCTATTPCTRVAGQRSPKLFAHTTVVSSTVVFSRIHIH